MNLLNIQKAVHIATNQNHLSTKSYRNSKHLQARANIYKFKQPGVNLTEWALSQITWRGGETILDVGCGPGIYLNHLSRHQDMQLIGMDLSHGMLAEVKGHWPSPHTMPTLAVCDAQSIPMPDHACDVVLAMHMLYHMPDILATVHEFHRVLKSDGILLAGTNSITHLSELLRVFHVAHEEAAGRSIQAEAHWSQRFSLETGHELLASVFPHVEKRESLGELVIPESSPVIDYLESTRGVMEKTLTPDVSWEVVMEIAARNVDNIIKAQGVFKARSATGVLICKS